MGGAGREKGGAGERNGRGKGREGHEVRSTDKGGVLITAVHCTHVSVCVSVFYQLTVHTVHHTLTQCTLVVTT